MNKLKDALHVSNVQRIKTTNYLMTTIANSLNDKPLFVVIAAGALFYAVVHDILKHDKNVKFRYGNFSLKTY